MWRPDL